MLVPEDLWVLDGLIIDPLARWWSSSSASEFLDPELIDCGGNILAPGYLDIQINGAFGVDFADPNDVTLEKIEMVARKLLAHGVVAFLPTLISSPRKIYHQLIPEFHAICQKLSDGDGDSGDSRDEKGAGGDTSSGSSGGSSRASGGARRGGGGGGGRRACFDHAQVLGLHLEGPFMNVAKKGAHRAENLREPFAGLPALLDTYGSLDSVKVVTLAPELAGEAKPCWKAPGPRA